VQGYRLARTGTAGQAEATVEQSPPPPATGSGSESGKRAGRLPGWSVGLAGGMGGELIIGVLLGRALGKRAHAEALAALLTPAPPQDIPPDVADRAGWMVWKRA